MQPGTPLGHYTILSALGKGGMGEVWRARDTKLGREVSIKTLPEEFARDADRLARFEREAKLLSLSSSRSADASSATGGCWKPVGVGRLIANAFALLVEESQRLLEH